MLFLLDTSGAPALFLKYTTGTPTYYVIRAYIRITGTAALARSCWMQRLLAPTRDSRCHSGEATPLSLRSTRGPPVTGAAISANEWHRLDLRFYCGATTGTIDWAIDGAAQTQATGTITASTFSNIRLGDQYNALGVDLYIDDIAISGTSGDYPLGPGSVIGLRPTSDGSYSAVGTNTMEDNAGADIGAANTAFALLDDDPWANDATVDYVRQATANNNAYAEVNFADATNSTINGVQAVLQYAAANADADTGACYILHANDSVAGTVWGNNATRADYSEATAFYKSVQLTAPAGGWTTAAVDGLKARIGHSNDVTPNPYWLALMLEVDGSGAISSFNANNYVRLRWTK